MSIPLEMKWNVVGQATRFGYEKLSTKNKQILINSILIYECYHQGYSRKMGSIPSFIRWYTLLLNKNNGTDNKQLVVDMYSDKRGNCTIPYTRMLQQSFPGLLHQLFRYAGNTFGYDANTFILISSMNDRAHSLYSTCEVRGSLRLTKYTFDSFFQENKGVIREPKVKPRLTDDHKSKRVVFVVEVKLLLKGNKEATKVRFYFCFIDEKWFYIFTNRKKNKYLPPGPGEKASDVYPPDRKVRSKRFVTKTMFMGIVAPPNPEKNFDGKIFIKRVSKTVTSKKLSYHQ